MQIHAGGALASLPLKQHYRLSEHMHKHTALTLILPLACVACGDADAAPRRQIDAGAATDASDTTSANFDGMSNLVPDPVPDATFDGDAQEPSWDELERRDLSVRKVRENRVFVECDCFHALGYPSAQACIGRRRGGPVPEAGDAWHSCMIDAYMMDPSGSAKFIECSGEAERAFGECLDDWQCHAGTHLDCSSAYDSARASCPGILPEVNQALMQCFQ